VTTPLLVVDSEGNIVGANEAATALLGAAVGTKCWDAVGGMSCERKPICTPGCLCNDSIGRVRGKDVRMVCSTVGDYVVVQLLPWTGAAPNKPLSAREREVLRLVADGLSSPAISAHLGIGVATVRSHVRNARAKLGARSRAEAVARALETGELE
jgi:DNA-binding CsgD family transcriptional regulator